MSRKTHPGSITKRGPSYRVRLCVDGERHYYTLKDVTAKEAREFAREKDRELRKQAERRSVGLPTRVTFFELLKRYKEDVLPGLAESTQRSYGYTLKAFKSYFVEELGDPKLEKIHRGVVKQFLAWRRQRNPDGSKRAEPLSNRSIEKHRAILHKLFDEALQWGFVDTNPVAATKAPKVEGREPVILSQEQYEKLLEECERDPMLHTYAAILGETGMRCQSEALWLKWEDLDFEEGFVRVVSGRGGHRTKSGRGRWVPMTQRLREILREHATRFRMRTYAGKRSPWVLHHTTSIRRATPGERIQTLRQSLKSAAERAELPEEWVFHDLRHRRVTTWLGEGKSSALVKEAMGHSHIQTTLGYMHLVKKHLGALVEEDEGQKEALKELAR